MTDFIGYVAALIGVSVMIPQIVRMYKRKKVEDISWGTLVLYFVQVLLWFVYGLLIHAFPVILANGTALIVSVIQICLMVRYSKKHIA